MDSTNSCCVLWRTRCTKSEEKRKALREGLGILKEQIDRLQEDNANLKKACDEERRRADVLEEEKGKGASLRISTDKEVSVVKSEITSSAKSEAVFGNDDLNGETMLLQQRIAERETEIHQLKVLISEAERRAESERLGAESARKRAAELQEALECEKTKSEEASKMADEVKRKADENKFQLERLKKEIEDKRSKCEEAYKKLEIEKQKTVEEKKHADQEKARATEHRKIAEANEKKYMEEKSHTSSLLKKLEEEKQKVATLQKEKQELGSLQQSADLSELNEVKKNLEVEKMKTLKEKKRADDEKARATEQRKIAEANEKKYMEEKSHVSSLLTKLEEEKQKVVTLQKEKQELVSLQRSADLSELDEVKKNLEAEKKKTLKEKKRADEEKAITTEQRKIAEANEKKYMEEKSRVISLLTKLEEEKHKVVTLENEKQELVSLQLSADLSELDEIKKNLEAEKKLSARERKRADAEMSKNDEQKKFVEANIKKVLEEKLRADELDQNLQHSRQRVENLEKEVHVLKNMLEAERRNTSSEQKCAHAEKLKNEELQSLSAECGKRAIEEKSRADNIFVELQHDRQRLQELENELHKLKLCGNLGVASSASSGNIINEQTANINLLQKQVKFEKQRVKHAKAVAKLEKDRSSMLQQELHRLKQDFKCLLHHLDVLGDTFGARHGVNMSKKLGLSNVQNGQLPRRVLGSSPPLMFGHGDAEPRISSLSSRDASCHLKEYNKSVCNGHHTESPSASFSDEQLMGSQDKVAGSLTTSVVLAAENTHVPGSTAKKSYECEKQNDSEKVGPGAENNVTSPIKIDACHFRKRRKILDEFESLKFMNSEGKRLIQEAEEKMSVLHDTLVQPMIDQMEKENWPLTDNNANACGNSDKCSKKRKISIHEPQKSSQQVDINIGTVMDTVELPPYIVTRGGNVQALEDASGVLLNCGNEDLLSFEQMMHGDYMKLLNLDDAVEEGSFRKAIERPISPDLPEIDLPSSETSRDLQFGMPINQHSCSALDKSLLFCVVYSNMKDVDSISRIFYATRTFSARCGIFKQRKWLVQDIVAALGPEKDLRPREKVCVFFSLLLLNVSAMFACKSDSIRNLELMDSFSSHLHSVLLDGQTINVFVEICNLSELLSLIEDFVLSRRVLLPSDNASAPVNGIVSSFEILYKGERVLLYPNMASINLIMSGAIVLASISKTVGHIDFVCEVSFNLLRSCQSDKSSVMKILHIFAYICGEQYLTSSNFHVVMEVVKSVVTFFEGSMKNGDKVHQLGNDFQLQFSPCDPCPFSKDCGSLDDVSSLLLKELQDYCSKHSAQQDMSNMGNILKMESLPCILDDVLSSLELITSIMGWDWTCDKIVPQLVKILESCNIQNACAVVVTFLGQLGRHGVETYGYNDRIETIRSHLLDILHRAVASKCNASLLMVVVCSLIGLYPNGFEEFVKGNSEIFSDGKISSSTALRECLSCLSSEQMSSLIGLQNPVIAFK